MAVNNAGLTAPVDDDMQGVQFGSARDIEITLTTLARTVTAQESSLDAAQATIAKQADMILLQGHDIGQRDAMIETKNGDIAAMEDSFRKIQKISDERLARTEETLKCSREEVDELKLETSKSQAEFERRIKSLSSQLDDLRERAWTNKNQVANANRAKKKADQTASKEAAAARDAEEKARLAETRLTELKAAAKAILDHYDGANKSGAGGMAGKHEKLRNALQKCDDDDGDFLV